MKGGLGGYVISGRGNKKGGNRNKMFLKIRYDGMVAAQVEENNRWAVTISDLSKIFNWANI